MYVCFVPGTTHTSAPTWPTTDGGQVTETTGVAWAEASVWYVGLKGPGAPAGSHTLQSKTWSEVTAYSETTRPVFTPSTPSSGSVNNGAAKAVFTMNASVTVAGAFLADVWPKSGTTGLLYGAGDFTLARDVINNDVVSITATVSYASG